MRLHYVAAAAEPIPVSMRVRLGGGFERARPVYAEPVTRLLLRPPDRELGSVWLPSGDPRLYLHGSTAGEAPEEPGGCIRVADAELLAAILLRGRPDWPLARIHAAAGDAKARYVRLPGVVPVVVVYGTAVARENGQVFFYQDDFGEDRRLERVLAGGPGGLGAWGLGS
jgi:hypothetical protein